ncbi:hypothetical protein Cgig2_006850 [Carnegiea gigantea]|uniref:BHLH domain-containing protein n=1 Tax=Carnegiea gigantea TaxID=171969 RepID=A0A9Q1Q7V1_9CARY|nr:hypothetical protein Cgig2_006850 [Carnegiea gigantea]
MHDAILQEMRRGHDLILNDRLQECNFNKDVMFGEELAAFLGDDFPYNNSNSVVCTDSTIFDPLDGFDVLTMSGDTNNSTDQVPAPQQTQSDTNVATMSGGLDSRHQQGEAAGSNTEKPKRRRQPSQVQDHIMAERKRRELLTQQFVALSAVTDKRSVLGETIKYLHQLKEKVKSFEEVVANKQTSVQSVVLVKKSQLLVDNINDNSSSCCLDNNDDNNNYANNTLPQIEVKVLQKNLLFKVHCEKQKGILPKLLSEIEKCGLTIATTSVIPLGALAFDITILAQVIITVLQV